MKSGKSLYVTAGAIALAAITFSLAVSAQAQTESTLYSFTGGTDGSSPVTGLISDSAGNLYGVAESGGNLSDCNGAGCGVVFELSPNGTGGWTQTVLHTFTGGTDGSFPNSALLRDAAGNLYGTTSFGGNSTCSGGSSCGTVFELSPSSGGWAETILYRFTGGSDGWLPEGTLLMDASGNHFGTAS